MITRVFTFPFTSSSTIPSIHYSSQGPGDIPTSHTPRTDPHNKPAKEEGNGEVSSYNMLMRESEQKREYQEIDEQEDGVYHTLGETEEGKEEEDDGNHTYEVPTDINFLRNGRVTTLEASYSGLQHY